ncbi:MAG TPA: iron-sulfur cluster assembly scaffold protein [Legionella sp.]|nr:iron-sulfur cluster assembly scaffold protein [Legionella sp.]
MMYNKIVQDYFFEPLHIGSLDLNHPDTVHYRSGSGNSNSNVIIDFYLRSNHEGLITKASFKTNGNPFIIAGLEWLCRQLEGHNQEQMRPISYKTLMEVLEIPSTQSPIAVKMEEVYKQIMILMKKN